MLHRTNHVLPLLCLYALFILYATTIPFAFSTASENLPEKLRLLLADPFQLKMTKGMSTTDVVSNILLFLPFGFLFVLARTAASNYVERTRVVLQTALSGLALSAIVEALQFFSEGRVASLLDCITDATGAVGGAVLALRYKENYHVRLQNYVQYRLAHAPELPLFGAYAILLMLAQLMPFDPTIDISTLKANLKAIDFALPQTATELSALLAETILYAGFSFLWLRTQKRPNLTRTIVHAILLTSGVALALECAQLFLVSQVVTLRNLLAGFEGGLYGAVWHVIAQMRAASKQLSARSRTAQKFTLDLALGHWCAYFLLIELQPYEFDVTSARLSAKLAQFHWLPFIEYYYRTGTPALVDFCGSLIRFTILALLLLARPSFGPHKDRVLSIGKVIGLAVGLSGLIEVLQLGLSNHVAGVTDCVNSALGVCVGFWLWQQNAKFVPPRFKVSSRRIHKSSSEEGML